MRSIPFRSALSCALLSLPLAVAAQKVTIESQGEAFIATEARALADIAIARQTVGVPPTGKAQIVFFSPGRSAASTPTLDIYDGGIDVGDLDRGTYFVATVNPGVHAFGLNPTTAKPLRLTIRPGRTLYVKASTGGTTGRAALSASNASAFLAAANAGK